MDNRERTKQQYHHPDGQRDSRRSTPKSEMDERMEKFIETYGQRAWREFLNTGKEPDQPQYPNGKANGPNFF